LEHDVSIISYIEFEILSIYKLWNITNIGHKKRLFFGIKVL
jgi:hypothetical protein